MPALASLLSAFVPIWALTAVGYLAARTGLLGEQAEDVLGLLVFRLAMPAALFGLTARTPLGAFADASLLAFAAGTVLAMLLGLAVSRWAFGRRPAEQAIGAMAAGYVNAANLGIPVAVQVLGDATFIAPVLLFQVLLVTPVVLTVLEGGEAGGRPGRAAGTRAGRLLLLPLRSPVILGAGLGSLVSATGLPLPQAVRHSCELLGGAGVPTALLVLGMSLHVRPAGAGAGVDVGGGAGAGRPVEIGASVVIKTLVQPLAAFAVGVLALHLTDRQLLAVVVCSALPTAQNVFIYARQYELSTVLARKSVLYSTLLSMLTLSAVGWALGTVPH
ncbi:AEC family transporter [Kitasatospora sp. NPDC057223]|uniref:AEC family transporter n=1 Tax=Kitasatospora sp. NPDC057223 TaxID=3346055 RepID=UPI0036459D50